MAQPQAIGKSLQTILKNVPQASLRYQEFANKVH